MDKEIMSGGNPYSFQVDSDIVQKAYKELANYLIEYDEKASLKDVCALYFSSNYIYFPNVEDAFQRRIIEKNAFEWYGIRVPYAYKHVFIRDIYKQWYLKGINSTINSPEKLLAFLQEETKGFRTICIGSSAGGYAAALYGALLNCRRVFAFNAQFEIGSLLLKQPDLNPLIVRLAGTDSSKYFDITKWVNFDDSNIFYMYSNRSDWDIEQCEHIGIRKGIHKIGFDNPLHGIPFLKVALPKVFESSDNELLQFEGRQLNPILFTIRMVGIKKTLIGFYRQYRQSRKKQ